MLPMGIDIHVFVLCTGLAENILSSYKYKYVQVLRSSTKFLFLFYHLLLLNEAAISSSIRPAFLHSYCLLLFHILTCEKKCLVALNRERLQEWVMEITGR